LLFKQQLSSREEVKRQRSLYLAIKLCAVIPNIQRLLLLRSSLKVCSIEDRDVVGVGDGDGDVCNTYSLISCIG
jgi:hypothetical protein